MRSKVKVATQPPKFKPGDIIASVDVCGKVETAFFHFGVWNYTLAGETAVDTDQPVPEINRPKAFRMGNRYIAEPNIAWYDRMQPEAWAIVDPK